MTMWKPAHRPLPTLMYRLKNNVRVKKRETSGPVLIQYTPLRVMKVNRVWQPLIEGLSRDEFIPFTKLAACVRQMDADRTASMLNTLTREGFLVQRGIPETDDTPKVSIIVSAIDNPRDIPACLRSLGLLLYPEDRVEIILITKEPEPEPDIDIDKMLKQWPQVRRITGENAEQLPACRNRAAREAAGEILAFIDVECVTNALWLKELTPAFREASLGAVGGMLDSYYEIGEIDQYMKFKFDLEMAAGNQWSGKNKHFIRVPACNLLVRRSVFMELEGFREDIPGGEETDFCRRIQENGHILEYKPAGRVSMRPRKQVLPFFTDCFRQGLIDPVLLKHHPEQAKHLFAPPAAILFWLLLATSMITGIPFLLAGCLAVLLADTVKQYIEIQRTHLLLNPFLLLASVLRRYAGLLYYTCFFISRHYLLFMFPLLLIFPLGGAVFLLVHLIAGLGSYWRIVPLMGQFSFMFFFTCEQIFYQAGLWRECVRSRDFRALCPRVVYGK